MKMLPVMLGAVFAAMTTCALGAGYTLANADRIQHQRAEIRARIRAEMREGYRFFTLEEYLANTDSLPVGSKVAVAGHYRDRDSISNANRQEYAYVTTDRATDSSKRELLQCLKTTVALGAPCPTMVLGVIATCSKTSFGYPDGQVSCIDVLHTWMLTDIDQVWSFDEVWTLSPLNEEILAIQQEQETPEQKARRAEVAKEGADRDAQKRAESEAWAAQHNKANADFKAAQRAEYDRVCAEAAQQNRVCAPYPNQ